MSAPDTSGWGEPELRSEIQRLRLREAKAKKKYDQAREEASEKEDEVGRLMEKLQDVMVSLCLLYTSPSPRDQRGSRMPSSA